MSISGSLSTMSLPDLLQWLAAAAKSGTLRVERNRVSKVIAFHAGRIAGCSSDDPPQRLGQYLISREKITAEQLLRALTLQQERGLHLGRILVEMGVIGPEELAKQLEAKAEETIYSLFDWGDHATFRFEPAAEGGRDTFPVDLGVEDVLLRGMKRFDEMMRIRQVFADPGTILRYTEIPPSPEIFRNKMARTMYAAIDGERSIAEILLLVHGSDYIVYKFLYELHRNGYVEIAGVKSRPEPDPPAAVMEAPAAAVARAAPPKSGGPAARSATAVAAPLATAAGSLAERLAEAEQAMGRNQYDVALEILDALYREHPTDESLRRLAAEAEAAFVDRAYRHWLPQHKVPVLTRPAEELATEARLSPAEFFLLSRIDGLWDVRSIIQVAPLREADALRTLKRLRELGMIELLEPAS